MRLHVGCAMWTHPAWVGRISPRQSDGRLRSYAGWCNAVEGNSTFYAVPARSTVESWAQQTHPDFRFVVKFPKVVTHERRFQQVDGELRDFFRVIEPLGARIDALWFQLPSAFAPADVPALEQLMSRLPRTYRYAVEVRHPQFFREDGEHRLRQACDREGAEWVTFDTTAFFAAPPTSDAEREAWERKPRLPRRSDALTDRPVVRFLGRDRDSGTVAGWQHWVDVVAAWLREGRSPTFFLHTPDNVDAPFLARRFHDEVRARVPDLDPLPSPEPADQGTLF
jgi:uncharacterized protein YecE (DUF72 family)